MSGIKQKIIEALDVHWDDLDEEQLLDILLGSYKKARTRILELQCENASERAALDRGMENIKVEQRKMRMDPLYMAHGEYYFKNGTQLLKLGVQGNHMELLDWNGPVASVCQQLSPAEWQRITK